MGTHYTLPKETCHLLDDIIDRVERADASIEYAISRLCEIVELRQIVDTIEEVRQANRTLRKAAETWEEELKDAEKERDELRKKVAQMEKLEEV